MLEDLIEMNNCKGETFSNEKLRQAIIDVREKTDVEHELNIHNITSDDSYQSYMKKKDASTINDSVYYDSDEQVETISDSNKQVDSKKRSNGRDSHC